MKRLLILIIAALGFALSSPVQAQVAAPAQAGADGVRQIEITTPAGRHHVWTKQVGDNPKLKVLLLHGGPAIPHDYMEAFEQYLPKAGVEFFYYDQLGAGLSDKPKDDALWTIPRYVDEVEQVRRALGLSREDFCLFGHSWGGILAIEYALKYQQNLKCLVISNMVASIPAYNDYARKVLEPTMDQGQLAELKALEKAGKTDDPRYMQILMAEHYEKHILRRPSAEWPEPVTRAMGKVNPEIYVLMQGPSELGASGRLANWDRFADLRLIKVPTLVIGARYDTMDPAYMEKMAKRLPKGHFLYSAKGSHMAMWDDQQAYFTGLTAFLKSVQ